MNSLLRSLLLILCLTASAEAHKSFQQDFTCPIDGEKFRQAIDFSGTRFGMRLDYKPLGPTPAPWAAPFCPKCHFVLYDEKFDAATLQKLKAFIQSDHYRADSKGRPSHYCLALIRAFMGADALTVGYLYLQASWQVETEPAQAKDCLRRSYEQNVSGLKTLKPDDERYVDIALLCGELERRLGQFDEAKRRFTTLQAEAPFEKPQLQAIIARQLAFIAQRDSAPHGVTKEDEKLMKEG